MPYKKTGASRPMKLVTVWFTEEEKATLDELAKREKAGVNPKPFLLKKSGQLFYNTSPLDLKMLMGDQDHVGENIRAYMHAFSPAVRDIFERFEFHTQIDRLEKARLLYLVTEKFATIDLHPDAVSNAQMGAVFEELIRKFAEMSNETAGEHFTPREVIRLMVNLLFIEDDDALTKPGVVRSIYDPTAGTGGMLSVAGEHLASLNPAHLTLGFRSHDTLIKRTTYQPGHEKASAFHRCGSRNGTAVSLALTRGDAPNDRINEDVWRSVAALVVERNM
jgi:type I restriction-modification system DNA methylase subunit